VHNRKAALRELAARAEERQAKVSAVGWMEGQRPNKEKEVQMQKTQQTQQTARELGRSAQVRVEQRGELVHRQQEDAAKQRDAQAAAVREAQAAQAREEAERQQQQDEERRAQERDGGRGW
jgi:hypothetical protein